MLGKHAIGAVDNLTSETDAWFSAGIYHALTILLSTQLQLRVVLDFLKFLLLLVFAFEFNGK